MLTKGNYGVQVCTVLYVGTVQGSAKPPRPTRRPKMRSFPLYVNIAPLTEGEIVNETGRLWKESAVPIDAE